MKEHFEHGFIVGKFMPLHRGHMHLIDTTRARCDALTIMLFAHPNDPIPGKIRLQWLKETYPDVTIIENTDPLPRDESGTKHWDIWIKSIKKYLSGTQIDVIFSSESYGEQLAKVFSSNHIMVDPARSMVPVSGTVIRKSPLKYLQYLPDSVKKYYY